MKEEITVSVLCAAFNHEKYIQKCLEGFIMQKTKFKFEVLINDDCSSDNTVQIIREFEERYPEIIKPIYQTENQYSQGVKIIEQVLLPLAQGEYIAICEGDDFWTSENKLQLQVEAMQANPDCKMCLHKVQSYYENMQKEEFYPPFSIGTGAIESYKFVEITNGYVFQTSSYFFDAKTFKEFANENPAFSKNSPVGDVCSLLYFANKGPVYYIDKTMSCYRRFSEGSWSQKMMTAEKHVWLGYAERICKTYEDYDEYTNGKFHVLMLVRIYTTKKQYKKIAFSKELREWRKRKTIRKRLLFVAKALSPRLTEKILKKYREKHEC